MPCLIRTSASASSVCRIVELRLQTLNVGLRFMSCSALMHIFHMPDNSEGPEVCLSVPLKQDFYGFAPKITPTAGNSLLKKSNVWRRITYTLPATCADMFQRLMIAIYGMPGLAVHRLRAFGALISRVDMIFEFWGRRWQGAQR